MVAKNIFPLAEISFALHHWKMEDADFREKSGHLRRSSCIWFSPVGTGQRENFLFSVLEIEKRKWYRKSENGISLPNGYDCEMADRLLV